MKLLSIAIKDLDILLHARGALLELLVLPLVFILIFVGVMAGPSDGDTSEQTGIPLTVSSQDDKALLQPLLTELDANRGLDVTWMDLADAEQKLADGEIERLLTVPAEFGVDLDAGRSVTLQLTSASDDQEANQSARLALEAVARDLALQHEIVASLEQMRAMQADNPDTQDALTAERAVQQAQKQFESSRSRPLITIQQMTPRILSEREEVDYNPVQVSVPGMTVLFVFLTAQATARSIYEEKKTGSFRRLLAAPLSKPALLAGKMLPNLFTGLVQVVVVFGTATLLFPLIGLDRLALGNEPLALIALVLVVVLCSTGMGVLIAAIARTEAQIGGVAQGLLWIMAFIGGSLVPTFLVNDALATIGRITPQGWANIAFYDVLVRGYDLAAIADSLLALLAFTIVFFAIGIWRFEFE